MIRVEFLNGLVRDYDATDVTIEEGVIKIRKSPHYGAAPKLKHVIPLTSIREVTYP